MGQKCHKKQQNRIKENKNLLNYVILKHMHLNMISTYPIYVWNTRNVHNVISLLLNTGNKSKKVNGLLKAVTLSAILPISEDEHKTTPTTLSSCLFDELTSASTLL